MGNGKSFEKLSRVVWVLTSDNGCVLAHGHPDPAMPPYHLDNVVDRLPAIVSAPNKVSLGDARRAWNDRVRKSSMAYKVKGRPLAREMLAFVRGMLVHERRVRITIEEA